MSLSPVCFHRRGIPMGCCQSSTPPPPVASGMSLVLWSQCSRNICSNSVTVRKKERKEGRKAGGLDTEHGPAEWEVAWSKLHLQGMPRNTPVTQPRVFVQLGMLSDFVSYGKIFFSHLISSSLCISIDISSAPSLCTNHHLHHLFSRPPPVFPLSWPALPDFPVYGPAPEAAFISSC